MPKSFKSPLKDADKLFHDPIVQACILASGDKLGCYYRALDSVNLGSADYVRALAHELGHYVFWLGDEYMDWHQRIYYVPDSFFTGIVPTYMLGGIAYSHTTAGWFYDNRVPPHSIMDMTYEYSELSWPADYERFKSLLQEKFNESWKEHLTAQWGNITKDPQTDYSVWHCSAWEAIYSFLTDHDTPIWIVNKFNNPKTPPRRQRIVISVSLTIDKWFKPKTGPYTGVGYFMEVTWG